MNRRTDWLLLAAVGWCLLLFGFMVLVVAAGLGQ